MQASALRKRCDVSEDCIGGLGCSAGLHISTYALPHTSWVRVGDNASTPGSTFWGTQPQNEVQILSQKGCGLWSRNAGRQRSRLGESVKRHGEKKRLTWPKSPVIPRLPQ